MTKRIIYLFITLVINIVLAFIMFRIRRENFPVGNNVMGYIFGYGLIYWLRPFLFVALVRLFYLMTARKFTNKVALSVYAIAWTVLLVGMVYM